MNVQVEFWGVARRLAGTERCALALPDGATVADALQALPLRDALDGVLSRCAYAVGTDLVSPVRRLAEGDVVSVLPPVSGG